MMKTFSLLLRGALADDAQALHDAHAVAILRQQIRDAAGAMGAARRELAVAMAFRAAEQRTLEALGGRIETVSGAARTALADGREELGREAAVLIAALEDERADRRAALARFAADVERLTALVAEGRQRLRDLDHGLQAARAAEAVRRAGLNGRRVAALSAGALDDAEQTLAGLQARQRRDDDIAEALADLEADPAKSLEARLGVRGDGRPRADPNAILAALRASA